MELIVNNILKISVKFDRISIIFYIKHYENTFKIMSIITIAGLAFAIVLSLAIGRVIGRLINVALGRARFFGGGGFFR
jgi:uncharacterized membrane protein